MPGNEALPELPPVGGRYAFVSHARGNTQLIQPINKLVPPVSDLAAFLNSAITVSEATMYLQCTEPIQAQDGSCNSQLKSASQAP